MLNRFVSVLLDAFDDAEEVAGYARQARQGQQVRVNDCYGALTLHTRGDRERLELAQSCLTMLQCRNWIATYCGPWSCALPWSWIPADEISDTVIASLSQKASIRLRRSRATKR